MIKSKLAAVLALAFIALPTNAQNKIGRVQRVVDGDTVIFKARGGMPVRVRLACIDAPEMKQEGGKDALLHLRGLVSGKRIELVDTAKRDKFGRVLGVLIDADTDDCINLRMVREGFAWDYKEIPGPYLNAQQDAQQEHAGIWQQANPEAPWLFRKEHL